eukprot:CAMPEP_0183806824 /NCGR_PEP_ID=MMETSP0803_2-20130417/40112_1 /TAXON_ID=195967 /ORGANISM="Crustomastix stigmata, Strain CCMP3273" /LENGTH=83 /DNA_ID=CAMNT_0026051593 /DNA_START=15 /DNA_END=262 /DNA_ORIENTATION=+
MVTADTASRVLVALKRRRTEAKLVFYMVAGVDGRVSYDELLDNLGSALEDDPTEWGFTPADMLLVLTPELFFPEAEEGEEPDR